LSSCRIGSGAITSSILAGVAAEEVNCDGAILVNVTAKKISAAKGCIVYNVATSGEIELSEPGSVLTTALLSDGEVPMRSNVELDGGKVWKQAVLGNKYSFEEIYDLNSDADVSVLEIANKALHERAASALGF
jgi:hypothetical protein